jgi:hypothetical protein
MTGALDNPLTDGPVRSLRLGIVLGGNIIEERLIRGKKPVSIGQSTRSTFPIPLESLPKQWPLFTIEHGRYVLHFFDDSDGRVSDGRSVQTLTALKGKGAERRADHWALPLADGARGKVVMGDLTVLFQFVNAPPLQPRPRLPASVRGTLADRVDTQLAVILGLSLALHVVLMIVAWNHDQTIEARVDRIHRDFEADAFREREATVATPEPTKEADTPKPTPKDEPRAAAATERPAGEPRRGDPREPGEGGEITDAQVEEAIQNTALIGLLTGKEGVGGRYNEMTSIDSGADLDKGIANARGKNIAALGGKIGQGGQRGTESGALAANLEGARGTLKGPGDAGGRVGGKEEEVISRVKLGDVEDIGSGTLDPDTVSRTIQSRYLAGIKHCHERFLKGDPSLGGQVTVRFTVGPSGGVTKVTVTGFDRGVDGCIKGLAQRWRFGAPKDDDGKPSSADFQFSFILKAGA